MDHQKEIPKPLIYNSFGIFILFEAESYIFLMCPQNS